MSTSEERITTEGGAGRDDSAESDSDGQDDQVQEISDLDVIRGLSKEQRQQFRL